MIRIDVTVAIPIEARVRKLHTDVGNRGDGAPVVSASRVELKLLRIQCRGNHFQPATNSPPERR